MENNDIKNSNENPSNFIRDAIIADNLSGRFGGSVKTRFPPEPNGYLHIGHAKAILIDYGFAKEFGGTFNLRFDDTNPVKEEVEYVDSILEDIRWLGCEWDALYWASDYFEKMYEYALELIKSGMAYVCDLSADEIRNTRGTLTQAGENSPYRNRSVEENLKLFERMKSGEFANGEKVLRAKIDMASPNMNMRDPVMYRILHSEHHHTGNKWCVYPMYDWAHGLEDSIEGITHSLCTLEYEDHRPLYDWFLNQLPEIHHPQQMEFARLNISNVVLSKRKLIKLVKEGYMHGWDDPRMPTLRGLKRRGFTPSSLQKFISLVGISKVNSTVDMGMLEFCLRDELNTTAPRAMTVLDPVKIIIDNYPDDKVEMMDVDINPEQENTGIRKVSFSNEIYIERDDFMVDAPSKFFRMTVGREVRLKHAYYVTCTSYKCDENGKIIEIHCDYDPASRGGWTEDARKVKGTLHWVDAKSGVECEVRLYDKLFTVPNPDAAASSAENEDEKTFIDYINPQSEVIIEHAIAENYLNEVPNGEAFQFLRLGYFIKDMDSTVDKPVFVRSVSLKDSYNK